MPISTFLNGGTATTLRGAAFLSFTDTAVIQSRIATSDSGGGATDVWSSVGTAACRIYPITTRAHSGLVGGQVNERTTHFVSLPTGTDVDSTQRVAILNRGTYEITFVEDRTDQLTRRIEVIQVF